MSEGDSAEAVGRHFPQGWPVNCPPQDAAETESVMYRAVENNPVSADDFQNAVEAGKFLKVDICARLAVSLNNTLSGVKHSFVLFPHRAGWHIATVGLKPCHGRVKPTPSLKQPDHVDWWPYDGVHRHEATTEVSGP